MSTLAEKLETLKTLHPDTINEAYREMRNEKTLNPGTYNQKELDTVAKLLREYHTQKDHLNKQQPYETPDLRNIWKKIVTKHVEKITKEEQQKLTIKTIKNTFKQPQHSTSSAEKTHFFVG